jgi:hypothetical protein
MGETHLQMPEVLQLIQRVFRRSRSPDGGECIELDLLENPEFS